MAIPGGTRAADGSVEPGAAAPAGNGAASPTERSGVSEAPRFQIPGGRDEPAVTAAPAPEAAAEARAATATDTVLGTTPVVALDVREIAVSVGLLFAWIGLISAGICIGTQPYSGHYLTAQPADRTVPSAIPPGSS